MVDVATQHHGQRARKQSQGALWCGRAALPAAAARSCEGTGTVRVFAPLTPFCDCVPPPSIRQFADDANRKRLEAMQAVQQARAQAEWLISAANVAKGETRAHQAQSRTQKQLIEALIAEVKGVRCVPHAATSRCAPPTCVAADVRSTRCPPRLPAAPSRGGATTPSAHGRQHTGVTAAEAARHHTHRPFRGAGAGGGGWCQGRRCRGGCRGWRGG